MLRFSLPAARRSAATGLTLTCAAILAGACSDPTTTPTSDPTPILPRATADVAPTNGLIGEWKLDESSGTIANDTKSGNDATVNGGATFVSSPLTRALNLNNGTAGTGGKFAEIPNATALDTVQRGDYTLSAWFNAASLPPDATIDNRFWAIIVKPGQDMGLVFNSVGRFVMRHYLTGNTLVLAQSANTYTTLNTWHHVAGVVKPGAGTVSIWVDGDSAGGDTFSPGTATRDYGTAKFRIGKTATDWAANGKVDQVRIYKRALTRSEIQSLANETVPVGFRFPIGMTKGQQTQYLGNALPNTPDGVMSAQSPTTMTSILNAARAAHARVIIRVTAPNDQLQTATGGGLSVAKWKASFDGSASLNANSYLSDGTLVGLMAIDEPTSDFSNVTGTQLESLCAYAKSKATWSQVPCLIRDKNDTLALMAPAGGYSAIDAGWAQLADHHYVPSFRYNGDMGAYFRHNLSVGTPVGLGLMYGFNLIGGGREDNQNCAHFDNSHNCAMSASEVREVADTLAAIGGNKGCGVNGWWINPNGGPEVDYFFSDSIQAALAYMHTKLAGMQPGSCG